MFNITKKSIEWGGRTLTLETGRIARQADGAVLATYGDTSVLAAVTAAKQPNPNFDFFPLTVHYQENIMRQARTWWLLQARSPSYRKRNTDIALDRPSIRPLFAKGFKNEVLVVTQVLSHDLENDPDVVAMIAASAALTIAGVSIPWPDRRSARWL